MLRDVCEMQKKGRRRRDRVKEKSTHLSITREGNPKSEREEKKTKATQKKSPTNSEHQTPEKKRERNYLRSWQCHLLMLHQMKSDGE